MLYTEKRRWILFEKDMTIPLLSDTYGALLSPRKRELLEYYYNDDCSLAEIAELTGISRQGIRESVKKSEAELRTLEAALHLAEKTRMLEQTVQEIQTRLTAVLSGTLEDVQRQCLTEISALLQTLLSDGN